MSSSSDDDLPEVREIMKKKASPANSDDELEDGDLKDDMEDLFGDDVDDEAEDKA
jgi:hypothetical protein